MLALQAAHRNRPRPRVRAASFMMKDVTRPIAARQRFSAENFRQEQLPCWPLKEDPDPRPTRETSGGRKQFCSGAY